MPSTVAVLTGLTFKSADLQDFPRIFFQIAEGGPGATPEVRGQNTSMPYRAGQLWVPKRPDHLSILLEGWFAGEGATEADARADTAAARAELEALFDPFDVPGTLSVTTEDGTVWTCEAEVLFFKPAFLPPIPTHVEASAFLRAIDPPYWQAEGS